VRFPRLELRKAKTALTLPNIGNPDGRGCPGCGWYIEQLVIDEDGWPVIVDGNPGPWPDELSGEHRRHLETEVTRLPRAQVERPVVATRAALEMGYSTLLG
jgi:hypothetical protein